jgi:D-alanyl-D-alanine carboxypeptidase
VRALSGFATTDSGDEIAFSILTDGQNAAGKALSDTIDRVVETILADTAPSKRK